MAKDLGRLSSAQLQQFVGILPQLFATLRETDAHIASAPAAKFNEVMAGDYGHYCLVYELPFMTHLSVVIVALNRQDEVHDWASAGDPQQAVLDLLARASEVDDKPHNENFDETSVLAMSYALARTIQSMARYGRSISGLLEDVREKGDQEALFKAIRADRAVVVVPRPCGSSHARRCGAIRRSSLGFALL